MDTTRPQSNRKKIWRSSCGWTHTSWRKMEAQSTEQGSRWGRMDPWPMLHRQDSSRKSRNCYVYAYKCWKQFFWSTMYMATEEENDQRTGKEIWKRCGQQDTSTAAGRWRRQHSNRAEEWYVAACVHSTRATRLLRTVFTELFQKKRWTFFGGHHIQLKSKQ